MKWQLRSPRGSVRRHARAGCVTVGPACRMSGAGSSGCNPQTSYWRDHRTEGDQTTEGCAGLLATERQEKASESDTQQQRQAPPQEEVEGGAAQNLHRQVRAGVTRPHSGFGGEGWAKALALQIMAGTTGGWGVLSRATPRENHPIPRQLFLQLRATQPPELRLGQVGTPSPCSCQCPDKSTEQKTESNCNAKVFTDCNPGLQTCIHACRLCPHSQAFRICPGVCDTCTLHCAQIPPWSTSVEQHNRVFRPCRQPCAVEPVLFLLGTVDSDARNECQCPTWTLTAPAKGVVSNLDPHCPCQGGRNVRLC